MNKIQAVPEKMAKQIDGRRNLPPLAATDKAEVSETSTADKGNSDSSPKEGGFGDSS